MKARCSILLLVVAFVLGSATCASAAKPKPKAKAKQTKLGAIGTTQLPGEWCKFGQAYTLGKENALNVTLKSAEYVVGHVRAGRRIFWPKQGEKLLVIHYSIHNPLPRERRIGGANITWTAVDANDKNNDQEYQSVGVDDGSHSWLDQTLKRAQKIEAYAVIRVPAEGEIPKLMAANRQDTKAPVARYDLRGKVKAVDSVYADPNDKTGATVLKTIPGVIGTSYATGNWNAKVEKVDFLATPITDERMKKGETYVVITLEGEYLSEGNGGFGGSGSPTSGMKLEDAEGVTYKYSYGPLSPSSNRRFSPTSESGSTIKAGFAFSVPKGIALKSLTLKEFHGYPVVIDLSAYKTPS